MRSVALSGISFALAVTISRSCALVARPTSSPAAFGQPVVNILARPSVAHEPGALQLGQVGRNARLTHVQNFLDLRHRQFRLFE